MSDKRELILVRLSEIVAGVNGLRAVYRNMMTLDEGNLPAASMLDGDEEAAAMPDPMRWRDAAAPQLVTMHPQIYVRVAANPLEMGRRLNLFRVLIHKAVTSDSELITLAGAARGGNGRIMYERMENAFSWGRSLEGEMILTYAITYLFSPADL